MKQVIKSILLTILMSMVGAKTYAYEFEAKNSDGVTIYYDYYNNGKELKVTCEKVKTSGDIVRYYSYYSGNVVIPEEVTYMGHTRKVTCIGRDAFTKCRDLKSVTIPKSVTTIESNAFLECSGLTSIIIPQNVSYIGSGAFYGCIGLTSITIPKNVTTIGALAFKYCDNLATVISLIENPFEIVGPTSESRVFSNNTFYNATLYVPFGTIEKYKSTKGWKDFHYIEEAGPSGGGDTPTPVPTPTPTLPQCATPNVYYQNGKLTFNCDTEGAVCQYSITDDDIKAGSSNEVQLGVTYHISVYATKEGFQNSETATATLCWIDVEPKTEGITNSVASVRARAVLIQNNGNQLTISGTDEGTTINVFDISGKPAGSAKASAETTTINTSLRSGDIGIVKIGEKAVKVLMK